MPIDAAHAGRSYPPTAPYAVSAAKITEFATALGPPSPEPVPSRPELVEGPFPRPEPVEGLVAPPTFAVVVAAAAWDALFTDPELELTLARIVHAEQSFRWERPLRAGDVVTATLTIDQVRSRGGADLIGTSAEIRTVDGELVLTAGSTFFHTREAAA